MALSFRQITKGNFNTSSASFALSFGVGIAAGSIIIVAAGAANATSSITISNDKGDAVTDSGKGTQVDATTGVKNLIQAFLHPTAGAITVTATYSGTNPTFGSMFIWEVSGFTNAIFDKVVVNPAVTGSTNPQGSSTGTLSSSNEVAIEYAETSGTLTSLVAPWISGQGSLTTGNSGDGITPVTGDGGGHQVLSATTAQNANFDTTAAGDHATLWCATLMDSAAVAPFPLLGQIWV